MADLLDRLAQTPSVDGTPMLDHTLVVHIKPRGINHSNQHMLWIAAGGNAVGTRTGRYLRLDERRVNDLHVTIGRMMGLTDFTQFGRSSENNGPLDLG